MPVGTQTRQIAETSSGGCLPDLPLYRLDPPQVRPVFSSGSAIADMLRRLSGVRVRVTLCRLALPCTPEVTADIVAEIEDPTLVAEMAPDGSVTLLDLGPRPQGPDGDATVAAAIARRLFGLLAEHPDCACLAEARLSVSHCWTDCLDGARASLEQLLCLPADSLNLLRPAA